MYEYMCMSLNTLLAVYLVWVRVRHMNARMLDESMLTRFWQHDTTCNVCCRVLLCVVLCRRTSARKRLAVPYRAADTPADRSEYAQPDVAILLTHISYYQ